MDRIERVHPDRTPFSSGSESALQAAAQAAINQLGIGGNAIGCGNDRPESAVESMYQIATGEGLLGPGATNVPANATGDVTFSVEAFNDFVPQESDPRLFVATIRVLADDCGELDEREVFILVPPADLPPPG